MPLRDDRTNVFVLSTATTTVEVWLENGSEVWTCKRGTYPEKYKICAIVAGDFVRYPGLPIDLGFRLNKNQQILEVR